MVKGKDFDTVTPVAVPAPRGDCTTLELFTVSCQGSVQWLDNRTEGPRIDSKAAEGYAVGGPRFTAVSSKSIMLTGFSLTVLTAVR